jgi:formimidoylglutamate deiminase
MPAEPARLFAADALLPDGWRRDVLIEWNDDGSITAVHVDARAPDGVRRARGPVVPGVPNVHSHAFQRAFAGLAEYRAHDDDSFWTWRDVMYRFAMRVGPDEIEAIATHLFVELLRGGYTSVCEFHYLHHDRHGRPYADDATLSLSLVRAAARAGIGLTLLPVLYEANGFGGVAPREEQRRFVRSVDSLLALIARLRDECSSASVRIGLALHSLRAVTPDGIHAAVAGLRAIDTHAPVHIHVAEQEREVEECVEWSGQRTVEWLLEHVDVDARWCFVHATHMNEQEIREAAARDIVAGLCPTTEADLGDGVFDAVDWWAAGGAFGLGSDSNVCTDALREAMLLEYGQRLLRRRRNVLADASSPYVATALVQGAVAGGARAAGRPLAGIATGQRADFVVLDASDPLLDGLSAEQQLSTCVFADPARRAIDVCVGGRWRVADGLHADQDDAAQRFSAARQRLLDAA